MKHKAPEECIPLACVDGSCPVALRNQYGCTASGVDWDFTCEDCDFWYDCKTKGRIK